MSRPCIGFDLHRPCKTCPFRRDPIVRLEPGRIDEITGMLLSWNGGTFQCHHTIPYGDRRAGESEHAHMQRSTTAPGAQHCAGALIFCLKHDHLPQYQRIAHRLGFLKLEPFETPEARALVFDSVEEMHAGHATQIVHTPERSAAAATLMTCMRKRAKASTP